MISLDYDKVLKRFRLDDVSQEKLRQAGQTITGVELRRELPAGNYAVRLGYKRVFAGEGPELAYDIDSKRGIYRVLSYSNDIDKDYLHLTVGGTMKLQPNLSLSAEGGWLKSQHDRELMADVKLNWTF